MDIILKVLFEISLLEGLIVILKVDRQRYLLDILKQHKGSVRISDLSRLLEVTTITIRRDVAELARQGRVLPNHGGVQLIDSNVTTEPIYHLKLNEETQIKDAMAHAALEFIEDGCTVFLDGGTTVGAVAKYLLDRHITVVTNALNVANVLSNSRHIRLLLIGGMFRLESQTFLGPNAIRVLKELRVDLALLGTEGFDWDRGFEVPDESDAEFKKVAIDSANKTVVMAAASKLGHRYLCRFTTWNFIDSLISSYYPHDQRSHNAGIPIIWANPEPR